MRTWYGLIGLVIVLLVVLAAIFAESLSAVDPYYVGPYRGEMVFIQEQDLSPTLWNAITPEPGWFGSSPENWSRVVYGARWTLFFGLVIGLGRVLLGLLVGMPAGMGSRLWKAVVTRWYMFTTAIPPLLIYVLLFVPPILRVYPREWRAEFLTLYFLILIVLEAPRVMLVVQGRLEELRNEPFYEGALAAGNTRASALRRHLLPHLVPTLATQFASEVARGLLIMATLGIFSVFLSGIKIDPRFSPDGALLGYKVSALVPEWGTMLAETISAFGGISTAPLLPASAFALLIVGFTLLADGMESLLGLVRRPLRWLREHTRWLHWAGAGAVVAVLATLAYHQGVPWGKAAGVRQALEAEVAALAAGDRAGFLAPVGPAEFRAEQAELFDRLHAQGATVTGTVDDIQVQGTEATARLTLRATFPDGRVLEIPRRARLSRSWGAWVDQGYDLHRFRSRLTTLSATFDPWDITAQGGIARSSLQDLATFLDLTLARMVEQHPGILPDGRLPVTFFPTDEELAASMGKTVEELGGVYLWYTPGQSMRISPGFRKGENPQIMEAKIQQQVVKLLIAQREPDVTPTLVMGLAGSANPYAQINVKYSDQWVGLPVLELPDLLRLTSADFDGELGRYRSLQSIYAVGWLGRQVPAEIVRQASEQAPATALQTLARAAGKTVDELTAQYRHEALAYLADLSLLKTPEGRDRAPAGLLDAVPAIAQEWAAQAGVKLTGLTPLKVDQYANPMLVYALVQWEGPQGSQFGVQAWPVVQGQAGWAWQRGSGSVGPGSAS
jgi:ABC-type dipeptide/oligopeptide/nickel transport system permease subunit